MVRALAHVALIAVLVRGALGFIAYAQPDCKGPVLYEFVRLFRLG